MSCFIEAEGPQPTAAVREIGFLKHNRHAESHITSTGVPDYAINHAAIAGDWPDCDPPPTLGLES